jgi:hypothetical protein
MMKKIVYWTYSGATEVTVQEDTNEAAEAAFRNMDLPISANEVEILEILPNLFHRTPS